MAENDIVNYVNTLQGVLLARKDWLESSEMEKLKDNLRAYHTSYASLYKLYLKKKLIDEDPYKNESKISELAVPESESFAEAKRLEQLSIRLSDFDNQLDFLANFYTLSTDFLNLERVKRIVGLVRYIDWTNLSPDNVSVMTKAVSELTNQSKAGVDTITLSIIGESLNRLSKTTTSIMATLKDLNTYYRENYKLSIRQNISQNMSANEATLDNIRKKLPSAMPGTPFYKELVDEILKEDYSSSGQDLRDVLLSSLMLKTEKKKAAKAVIDYKSILLDGIQVIGGASKPLTEIAQKLDENNAIFESEKKGFIYVIKELIRQITNGEPEEIIYNIEYFDQTKDTTVKERVNFHQFRSDLDKKIKILSSFMRGAAYNKIAAMQEDQVIGYLERNIKDMQTLHKTLNALDDYFKAKANQNDRTKIKGIKPELSALKNTFVKANQLRYDYSAQKEEDEQMKRLGINRENDDLPQNAAAAPPQDQKKDNKAPGNTGKAPTNATGKTPSTSKAPPSNTGKAPSTSKASPSNTGKAPNTAKAPGNPISSKHAG
ncbi:MAG: hypothetical protein LBC76_02570 [Treponema sp.]|jgi:hypothetical protein|nr:hypothetical protein [Treponema sp.]